MGTVTAGFTGGEPEPPRDLLVSQGWPRPHQGPAGCWVRREGTDHVLAHHSPVPGELQVSRP